MGWRDIKVGEPDIIPKTDPHTGEQLAEELMPAQKQTAKELGWYRDWLLTTKREEDV